MNSLQPIPADELSATYNTFTKYLTLYAKGVVHNWAYGFEFDRQIVLGGLWYKLQAWVSILPMQHPYTFKQDFFIPNLPIVAPSNRVVIITKNGTKVVPIEWVSPFDDDLPPTSQATIAQAATLSKSEVEPPSDVVLPPEPISVLWPEKFTIKTPVPAEWTVHPKYDRAFVALASSGVDRGTAWWEFQPLRLGDTQILIYGNGLSQVVENLRIFAVSIVIPIGVDGSSSIPKQSGELFGGFVSRLLTARTIVQDIYPDAQLIMAKATLPIPGPVYPVDDPRLLSQTQCVFRVEKGSVSITSYGGPIFGKPVFSKNPRLGLGPIDIEKELKYDLVDAHKVMLGQGITMSFFDVELTNWVGMKIPELPDGPQYRWAMLDGSTILTSPITGVVYTGPEDEIHA